MKMIKCAGLLMFKIDSTGDHKVLLCRSTSSPGSPSRWGIPKGRIDSRDKTELDAAKREFHEETGLKPPENHPYLYLGNFIYPNGRKRVSCWAFNHDPGNVKWKSNIVKIEKKGEPDIIIPEVDAWEWYNMDSALEIIMISQKQIIQEFYNFIKINN